MDGTGYLILMYSPNTGTCIVGREVLEDKAAKRAGKLQARAKHGVQYWHAPLMTMRKRIEDLPDDCDPRNGLAVAESAPLA